MNHRQPQTRLDFVGLHRKSFCTMLDFELLSSQSEHHSQIV